MGNSLGCGCGTRNLKDSVAEETTSVNNTSPNEAVNHVVKRFSELPDELLVEVLCKVPVKSLIRVKLVCKPWKCLIESPVFIDTHLHRRNPQRRAIHTWKPQPNNSHAPPYLKGHTIGASNGIICFKPNLPEKRLYIFNPSIRERSFTPDEFDGMLFFGFCYLSKTQKYQIISFSDQRDNNNVDMVILTLGKSKSSRAIKDVTLPGRITEDKGATSGSTIVWLGTDDDGKNEIVICYDAIEERFSKMGMPPSSYSSSRSLSILNNSVVMFVYPKANAIFFDIWILDGVSKSKEWRKYRKVGPLKTNIIMEPVHVGYYAKSILCLKRTVDNEYSSCNLFYYDLETDQVEDHDVNAAPTMEVVNYIESLISMKSLGLELYTTKK